MKKRILLCSLLGVISVCSFSQSQRVGINTENPQGVFHIDGKNNSGTSTSTDLGKVDDFIVDFEGNVGIGTTNPHAKLEIIASQGKGIRVKPEGTITPGTIITSDEKGNFAFGKRPYPEQRVGNIIQISTPVSNNTTTKAPNIANTTPNLPPNVPAGNRPAVLISDQPLVLSEGIWLIQLKYTTRTTTGMYNDFGFGCGRQYGWDQYIWTLLYDETNKELLTTVGTAPERQGICACTPQLSHVVEVEKDKERTVNAYASTSISNNTIIYVDGDDKQFNFKTGKPYFKATRLDTFKASK